MAYRVDVLPRAARDLRTLYAYIGAQDSVQARTWFNDLETLIDSLDEQPERGAITPEDHNLRQLLFGSRSLGAGG